MLYLYKFHGEGMHKMKINTSTISNNFKTDKFSYTSKYKEEPTIVIFEIPEDTFTKLHDKYAEDVEIAAGPHGHPYSGRPTISSDSEDGKMTFIDWLFCPERKLHKRPKTFIDNLLSLGDNNFDDDVSRYHAQLAKDAIEKAKNFIGKDVPISIPIGDINKDGVADTIISGINKAIDITGDGKADIIGTLIDVTGDGKADYVIDKLGNLTKINSDMVRVIDESGITFEDLKDIPNIILTLLNNK